MGLGREGGIFWLLKITLIFKLMQLSKQLQFNMYE
jgi:hypothetical protein